MHLLNTRMLSPRLQTCLMRSRIAAAESATCAYSVCIHHILSLVGTLKEALVYGVGVVSDQQDVHVRETVWI